MKEKISSILLAGGKSERMGEDKAFLKYRNDTFIKIITKKLYRTCDEIIISINKNPKIYEEELYTFLDKIVFVKDKKPYDGPLNAIVSAAEKVKHRFIFIATVDTPLLNPNLIDFYLKKIKNFECIIPVVKEKFQPLNTLYTKEALEKAKEVYKTKKSLIAWIEQLKCLKVYEDEISKIDENLYSYWSINTKGEYKKLLEEIT